MEAPSFSFNCMLHTATQIQLLPFHNSQILVAFTQSKGDKPDGKCQVWKFLFLFMFLLFQLQTHFISSQSIETCLSMML